MNIGSRLSSVAVRIAEFLGPSDGDEDGDEESTGAVPDVAERTGFDGSVEDAKVIGRSPLSYVAAGESISSLMGKHTNHKLATYGLEEIEPDEWYPLDAPLAMLFDMREEYGEATMQTMGQNVPEHVAFPPEIDEVETALHAIDEAYHGNHHGEEIGFYEFAVGVDGEGTMICENPYPCEFDQGLIRGVAQKFADSPVQVEEVGDRCRAEGGTRCTYRVDWVDA